tara:strand:+ start:1273 stop:1794 length:522 start_codon:yes stop_codon:yes gene_type:complete
MYEDVKCLLSEEDKQVLLNLSEECRVLEGDYLEIGCYEGGSTLHICHNMPQDKKLHVFDFYYREYFEDNIIKHHIKDKIIFYQGDFTETYNDLPPDDRFAFIFVDNNHSYDNTRIPMERLWPRLNAGGYMLFHDYGHINYPGVKDYLDSLPEQKDREPIGKMGCSFGFKKKHL